MDKNTILVATIALLLGFIAGFLLANSINRSEMNAMRSQVGPAPASNTSESGNNDEPSLTAEEIRQKVAEADRNPDNFNFQRDLGIGLYRYGAMKKDIGILAEAARILARANSLEPKDFEVLVNVGNADFDLGYAKKEASYFDKARNAYNKALAIEPDDANVRADLGISYYVQPTPDYAKASAELQKVIAANPRHDRSILYLARVYVDQGKIADGEKLLARLRMIDPKNSGIGDLADQIERAKNGTK